MLDSRTWLAWSIDKRSQVPRRPLCNCPALASEFLPSPIGSAECASVATRDSDIHLSLRCRSALGWPVASVSSCPRQPLAVLVSGLLQLVRSFDCVAAVRSDIRSVLCASVWRGLVIAAVPLLGSAHNGSLRLVVRQPVRLVFLSLRFPSRHAPEGTRPEGA